MRARFLLSVLCPLTAVLCACSTPRSTMHYSPPSAAPVRDKISSAQGHAKAAKTALLRGAQAASLLDSAAAPNLLLNLDAASKELDALTLELTTGQTALKDYETKVADQTAAANRAIDEKNAAITARDRESAKAKRSAKREHLFFLLFSGALIWIFRVPLLALLKLLAALITKIPI